MLKCQTCETLCDDAANFCRICGKPLELTPCDHDLSEKDERGESRSDEDEGTQTDAEPEPKPESAESAVRGRHEDDDSPEVLYTAPDLAGSNGGGGTEGSSHGKRGNPKQPERMPEVLYDAAIKAELETRLMAEMEAKLKAEIEAKLKVELEERLRAEIEAQARSVAAAASAELRAQAAEEPKVVVDEQLAEPEQKVEAAPEPEPEPEKKVEAKKAEEPKAKANKKKSRKSKKAKVKARAAKADKAVKAEPAAKTEPVAQTAPATKTVETVKAEPATKTVETVKAEPATKTVETEPAAKTAETELAAKADETEPPADSFEKRYDILGTTPFQGLQIQTEDEATFFAEEHPDLKAQAEDFSDLDGPRPLHQRKANHTPYIVLAGVLVASVALVGAFFGFSGSSHSDRGTTQANQTKTAKTDKTDKADKADKAAAALAARPRQSPPRLEAPPDNTPSARMNALADAMDKPATDMPATPTLAPEHNAKDAEVPTPPTPPTPSQARPATPAPTPAPVAAPTPAARPAPRKVAALPIIMPPPPITVPRPAATAPAAATPAAPVARPRRVARSMPRPAPVDSEADQLARQARKLLRTNRAQAEKLAQQALLKQPSQRVARRVLASILTIRAKAYLYAGNNNGAVRAASRAVRLNSGEANAWFYLGVANSELGRKPAAARHLKRYLRLCPHCGYNSAYARRLISAAAKKP